STGHASLYVHKCSDGRWGLFPLVSSLSVGAGRAASRGGLSSLRGDALFSSVGVRPFAASLAAGSRESIPHLCWSASKPGPAERPFVASPEDLILASR